MFTDRVAAATVLAKQLQPRVRDIDLILGLARGGVVVSSVLSRILGIPHDVLVVKKVGSPGNPELAIGAVAPGDTDYPPEAKVVRTKMKLYRRRKPALTVRGKAILLVDDGAATGETMAAAIRWGRRNGARSVTVAIPVAPPETEAQLIALADDVIVLEKPQDFGAVGEFFNNFSQVTDEEVIQLLS